ncbi:hypothetical protein FB45DRAFT_873021 [Roridomyces roridus]|uniref:Uncharacterized protein n=1 Tax=Roridomyces roridus TaxID=1738132 RepID=A0AAD7BBQ0_9AGAR|nr:hypothetical protein FB45DRAFT_873021 [Roridomyces roridus]
MEMIRTPSVGDGWSLRPSLLEADDICLTMRGLHSVLDIALENDSIIPRHASFRDFLPCSELLPLLRAVNLDFFFLEGPVDGDGYERVVNWKAKTHNCPRNLLELWERIHHVRSYGFEYLIHRRVPGEGQTPLRRLQMFAHFLRIDEFPVCPLNCTPGLVNCTRLLMDISWPEMLNSMWDLQFAELGLDMDDPVRAPDLYADVAAAFVRLFRKVRDGEISLHWIMEDRIGGTFADSVTGCPPSDLDLLYELNQLSSNWTEISATRLGSVLGWSSAYCIMKWLQTSESPACPPDLVRQWEFSVSASNPHKTFTLLPFALSH